MSEIKLLPCPFCGEEVKLEEFYESCDGRGDKFARIKCKCGLEMSLTWDEFAKAKEDFNYTGGYYSQNKKFWKGMHQRLIEKWNTRKPMERLVSRVCEVRNNTPSTDFKNGCNACLTEIHRDIYITEAEGESNGEE